MKVPTVHLNGTGAQQLCEQYHEMCDALNDAIDTLCKNAPHGRDYYPQGDSAFAEARAEHDARIKALTEMRNELMGIFKQVYKWR